MHTYLHVENNDAKDRDERNEKLFVCGKIECDTLTQ